MIRRSLLSLALALTMPSTAAIAQGDSWISYGKQLVEANCAACHGISLTDASSHPDAPPFRTLGERYPIDALEESFVEGIFTGHPDMPQFVATPRQINAIIDYIGSLTIKN
jgi:mono/diheme cytochrome c family protein